MTDTINEPKSNQSARTMLWLAGILILTGMVVMSPAASMVCAALASLSAAVAILLARGTVRTISIIITVGALIMTMAMYPGYKTEMDRYRQRASEQEDIRN